MDLREEENWIKPDKIVSGYWELLEVFFKRLFRRDNASYKASCISNVQVSQLSLKTAS